MESAIAVIRRLLADGTVSGRCLLNAFYVISGGNYGDSLLLLARDFARRLTREGRPREVLCIKGYR